MPDSTSRKSPPPSKTGATRAGASSPRKPFVKAIPSKPIPYYKRLASSKSQMAGVFIAASMAIFLFLVLIDAPVARKVLSWFGVGGIYNTERGIYADCNDRSNRDSNMCTPKDVKAQRDWRSATESKGSRSVPFDL